jgi:restriction endonuclease Mrr
MSNISTDTLHPDILAAIQRALSEDIGSGDITTFFGSLEYHKAGTVVAFIVIVVAIVGAIAGTIYRI